MTLEGEFTPDRDAADALTRHLVYIQRYRYSGAIDALMGALEVTIEAGAHR